MSDSKPHILQSAMHLLRGGDHPLESEFAAHARPAPAPETDERHVPERAEQSAQNAERLSLALASLGHPFRLDESYPALVQSQMDEIQSALAEQHRLVRSTLRVWHTGARPQNVTDSPGVEATT